MLRALGIIAIIADGALMIWALVRGATQRQTPPAVRRYREHEGYDRRVSCPQEPRRGAESDTGCTDASPPPAAHHSAEEAFVPFAGILSDTLTVEIIDPEVAALDAITHAFEPLSDVARERVLEYAAKRYVVDREGVKT